MSWHAANHEAIAKDVDNYHWNIYHAVGAGVRTGSATGSGGGVFVGAGELTVCMDIDCTAALAL